MCFVKVKIKLFDKSLPIPGYKSKGAACVDMYARVSVKIAPHAVGYIPLNAAMEVPPDCWVMLASRGSTHKMGIMAANGIGIIDPDFKGDTDEIVFPALNFTDNEVLIEKGTRIAQLMVVKFEDIEFEEVETLGNKDRGKFGSTGSK